VTSVMITMPQLGLTMTEGTVGAWLKKPGETVKKDDIVLTVSTDKVDMDVESPSDGIVGPILIEVGETVPVGTPLISIVTGGGSADETATSALPSKNSSASTETTTTAIPEVAEQPNEPLLEASVVERERIVASPRARKMAADLKVDLARVQGSGAQNRIVAEDVERAAASVVVKQPPVIRQPSAPDTQRRKIIADRMVESITTIPAFSVSVEVNAEQLVALYDSVKEPINQSTGVKLTYTDLFMKAIGVALPSVSQMNSVWDGDGLRGLSEVSAGLAVATDRGVVVPTLVGIDQLSLPEIARRCADLTERARRGKLTFADMEGASGTLSNLGMYRVDRFQGIITPGQTFILAIGRLGKRPWWNDGLTAKPTVILNLSVDHRVADGASAAIFLQHIAEVLENPYQLLLGSALRSS
jgi:pyruvate dehydrogenase E2 component (dihydrolipoamide acetyltransferase)